MSESEETVNEMAVFSLYDGPGNAWVISIRPGVSIPELIGQLEIVQQGLIMDMQAASVPVDMPGDDEFHADEILEDGVEEFEN